MFVVFLVAVAVGAVVVALRAADVRGNWASRPSFPRHSWLLIVAIVPQQLWVRWISHQPDLSERFTWLVAGSFLPLIVFLYFNRAQAWAKVIAVGVVLNLSAMIAFFPFR